MGLSGHWKDGNVAESVGSLGLSGTLNGGGMAAALAATCFSRHGGELLLIPSRGGQRAAEELEMPSGVADCWRGRLAALVEECPISPDFDEEATGGGDWDPGCFRGCFLRWV